MITLSGFCCTKNCESLFQLFANAILKISPEHEPYQRFQSDLILKCDKINWFCLTSENWFLTPYFFCDVFVSQLKNVFFFIPLVFDQSKDRKTLRVVRLQTMDDWSLGRNRLNWNRTDFLYLRTGCCSLCTYIE